MDESIEFSLYQSCRRVSVFGLQWCGGLGGNCAEVWTRVFSMG